MSWDLYMTAVRADAETAEQLADSIRSYRLPKGVTLPDSGLDYRQVIVDASDEPLDDSRKEQLQQSRFLVVVCSPATRTSAAVGERLAVFLSSHDKNSIIAVIASGEPAESFPEMFIEHQTVRHIMPDMTVIEREETIEPVAADLRGDTPARRKQLLCYETVRIAASVLGLHPDDLEQRHRSRERRTARTIIAGAAAVCLSAAALFLRLGYVARKEGQIAEQQTELSMEIASRTMHELPELFKDDPEALTYIEEAVTHARESLSELGLDDLLEEDGQEDTGS